MGSARNIVEWLDRSADDFPGAVAIEDARGAIRYDQWRDLARGVHSRLAGEGVRPGDRVGVLMRKSIDTLVAFHAILRSGAAYVPADATGPVRRAALVLHDCQASAVFVDENLAEELRDALSVLGAAPRILAVPGQPASPGGYRIGALAGSGTIAAAERTADDLAFLLYTSGSTGKPKAAMLTHGNVVTFIDWCSTAFAPSERDKFATHAPLHFSLSVFNLYVAWKHGGTVVLIDENTAKVPELVGPLIERAGITVWFSTPTILTLLVQHGALPSLRLDALRLVMFAGEPFRPAHLQLLRTQLPNPRYVHVLGSTETHIIATYDMAGTPLTATGPVPIGSVCEHFRYRLLEEQQADVAPGDDGELCLSGPAVTPGYWNARDDATRAFFDERGTRWYRTGDIVRVQPDGNLVYRGRRDRLIKKRGYRVELAEIESCLYENTTIKEVAVVAVPDDDLGLKVTAFVVPSDGVKPSVLQLKAHCAKALPLYMVPDRFAFQPALPRTSNGKIDLSELTRQA